MRKKKPKGNQKPTVQLSPMEQISLRSTRELLRDSGLKMPRITNKYWSALKTLSQFDATSLEFYHIAAARKGPQIFYEQLKKLGYVWKKGKWQRTQPVEKERPTM
jgi:hypothetical protein